VTQDEQKELVKQAIKEWMTEQKAAFGWWSIKTLGIAALMVFLSFYFAKNGIKFP
jgi:hypothetical protein